jgi:signal transduction histidine kinase/ActR/RegA family two-component response regulator
VQLFINHAGVERAAAELISGPRARYYLFGLVALAVAAAAGLAPATVWLGLALLVEVTRKALVARVSSLSAPQAGAACLALDIASTASLAVAPAIAWYAHTEMSAALTAVMLCVLLMDAAHGARRGRLHAATSCAPYGLLGVMILAEADNAGAFTAMLICGGAIAYVFMAALHRVHAASHARVQDAEWVRQLNMSFGEAPTAAWEIDFERGRLAGAQRLAALLGRPVSFADVVDGACFAAPEDRALVKAAFAPERGEMRRIVLEHDVVRADGARVRVRHQGFIRVTPDGAPVRLTCVTRPSDAAAAAPIPARGAAEALAAALTVQAETLRTLSNELSIPLGADLDAAPSPDLAQALRLLAERGDAIDRGVNDLAHVRHVAESANLAKSQFLANMSHELRTPLNAVIGYAEMLQEDAEDSGDVTSVQDLNRILAAAKHLLGLLNEILDLSKIEAGRMDVVATEFDPHEMLGELVATMRPLAEQNGNTIRLVGRPIEGRVSTDAMKLRQCVLNLLSNAAKFTRAGAIEVTLARRACAGVEQLFIVVHDTGIGMSKEHVMRLFQPFMQADPSIMREYGGTGLGLTITRRLAQLLGGDVSVESRLGQGSTFTLHVPADFADAALALGAAAQVDEMQGDAEAPLVVVIEDEPDARELAARALTRAGFSVQGVGGGEAGLALARAKAPALVLLDIFLPDRSGWRVLQSLKHDPKTQDIPVVVLSVNEDRAHAMALGAAEHIVKPVDRDRLAATVMRFARKRAPGEEAASAAPPARSAPRARKKK